MLFGLKEEMNETCQLSNKVGEVFVFCPAFNPCVSARNQKVRQDPLK